MDREPETVDGAFDDLSERIANTLKDFDWMRDVQVRVREAGQVMFAEAFIQPADDARATERTQAACRAAHNLDWRLIQMTIQFSQNLSGDNAENISH